MVSASRDAVSGEEGYRTLLETLRWPDGVRCPRCDADSGISRLFDRSQFECDRCGYQFSVRSGTVLHGSRLPLETWVHAVSLIVGSEDGISTSRLGTELGVSHKTAWFLSQRIHVTMRDEALKLLSAEPHGDGIAQQRRALLQRAVVETHRRHSSKHLDAYLDGAAYRLRNSSRQRRTLGVLVRLLHTPSTPYASLTAD